MKLSKYFLSLVAVAGLSFAGCDKDGDIIYVNPSEDVTLDGNQGDIVLDYDHIGDLALTIYWTDNGYVSLSDPRVEAASGAYTNTLQFGADEAFATVVEYYMETGVYQKQFTVGDLNNTVTRLGFVGGEPHPLYIRIKSTLGANIDPSYSNVLALNVTPYYVDKSFAYYLNSSHEDTGKTLASPYSDGVYYGFIGAGSWENWYLKEGDGVEWGNDGVAGTPFLISSADTKWNFWYPGVAGCYYTILDTHALEWSALLIPTLNVSGDISGEMVYDRKENVWTYTFEATAKTYNVTLSGAGKQYTMATGTDDAAAIDCTVGFGGDANALSFGSNGSQVSVTCSTNGEATLTLDLNDPKAWSLKIVAGGVAEKETVPENLYFSGLVDPWTFDDYLKLYNEDNKTYGGVHYVNSQWGYRIYPDADWSPYYSMAEGGNAFEGQLVLNGDGNIEAPSEGIYLFDVSMSALTYKLTAINSVSYTGLNDDWSITPMTATDDPCVFTAEVQKTANTPWGVKILLNESWDLFFGGNGTYGELRLYQDGFEGDNDLENGTYILTVDLARGTYSYTAK